MILHSTLSTREDLASLCNDLSLLGIAVEVGTDRGTFALGFRRRWRGNLLICVDPWEPYEDMPWDREADFISAVVCLSPFLRRGIVRIIRDRFSESLCQVLKRLGPVNFFYLDGDHSSDAIRRDVALTWPMLGSGGVMAGHDWNEEHYPQIVETVSDLCVREGIDCFVIPNPESGSSWYVRKP